MNQRLLADRCGGVDRLGILRAAGQWSMGSCGRQGSVPAGFYIRTLLGIHDPAC